MSTTLPIDRKHLLLASKLDNIVGDKQKKLKIINLIERRLVDKDYVKQLGFNTEQTENIMALSNTYFPPFPPYVKDVDFKLFLNKFTHSMNPILKRLIIVAARVNNLNRNYLEKLHTRLRYNDITEIIVYARDNGYFHHNNKFN